MFESTETTPAVTMAAMSRLLLVLFVAGLIGLGFAFVYQPKDRRSRFGRLRSRIRTVGYAYVAAVLISAALRVAFGWGG